MSIDVGLWRVLASSVLATSGVIAVGLSAVPVLVPHPQTVEPVNVVTAAPTPATAASSAPVSAPAGWDSASEQYAADRALRALQTTTHPMVAGSPWTELEWLSGGTHTVRATFAPHGVPPGTKPEPAKKAPARDHETKAVSGAADHKARRDDERGENRAASTAGTDKPTPSPLPTTLTTTPATPTATPTATPGTPTTTPPPAPQPPKGTGTLRLVQANIKTSMDNGRWFADYARVTALKPDFITLNEASTRTDAALTASGYGIHRAHTDASTRETPVLWRLDTWDETASGTRYLTTRHVKWGVRAVNWVTVKNLHTGQVVSVISAHPAPTIPVTRGLLPEFMQGLAALTRDLAAKGPVFIGGDLNVHYQSDPYPRAALASAGLQSTFDTLGRLPTGDHGAIIDYMLFQPGKGVTALRQGKVEQNSDHHTLWADFALPR